MFSNPQQRSHESMHAVQLNTFIQPANLRAIYESTAPQLRSLPAGYPGEKHMGWTSLTVHEHGAAGGDANARLADELKSLGLDIRLARFLTLEPGGIIAEHRDAFLSGGVVRLHVPVVTHPDVEFYIDGHRCFWQPGELWYGDFFRPHRAINKSPITRIHLVMDVTTTETLLRLFPANAVPSSLKTSRTKDDAGAIGKFSFTFSLPRGFQVPGTPYERLDAPTAGAVRVVNGDLLIFINEQPLLRGVPVADNVVEVLGLGDHARLHYVFNEQCATSVTLSLGAAEIAIPLDLLG
jgi:hypothetical protein